jgi:hypothetical protein
MSSALITIDVMGCLRSDSGPQNIVTVRHVAMNLLPGAHDTHSRDPLEVVRKGLSEHQR